MDEKPQFEIDHDTLERLPSKHREAAEAAIMDGRWKIKDDKIKESR